jgi:hypothetical protein
MIVGLLAALTNLRDAGCQTAFIDGSFVTSKKRPRDLDGCWDIYGVDKSLVDPVLLDQSEGRRAQKEKYLGELFDANFVSGFGEEILDFFKKIATKTQKGS